MKMKRFKQKLIVALILSLAVYGNLSAQDLNTLRQEAQEAFDQLTQNSIQALKIAEAEQEHKIPSKDLGVPKFNIPDVKIPGNTSKTSKDAGSSAASDSEQRSNMSIEVWFELEDGAYVNPTKRRWNPNEKFYIHVKGAVPIFVALFQNYPDSRPTSRQVYPDIKYAESFCAINPADKSTKIPVLFALDNDPRTEIMSMVVVRADWTNFQPGLNAYAAGNVQEGHVASTVNIRGAGTMKCLNERIVTNEDLAGNDVKALCDEALTDEKALSLAKMVNDNASMAKFQIFGSEKSRSDIPKDVSFFMFSAGYIGQWQMTIVK